jgi:ABC-type nitrate/sulfonate/bicarbonate transport system ATPase subunit
MIPHSDQAGRRRQPYRNEVRERMRDASLAAETVEKMRSEGLRAFFGSTETLKGISMPIKSGCVTAIIGPSGCGKSTFIRCLNRTSTACTRSCPARARTAR